MVTSGTEIELWFKKALAKEMQPTDISRTLHDLGLFQADVDKAAMAYALSQVNSLAGFIFWYHCHQNQLQALFRREIEGFENGVFSLSPLFPVLAEDKKIVYLVDGCARVGSREWMVPSAFRELKWFCQADSSEVLFPYDQKKVQSFCHEEIRILSALLAGIKKSLYKLTVEYTETRSQGGRKIQSWSQVKKILLDLSLVVCREKNHMQNLTFPLALDILQSADHFSSQCVQLFGGAGYTEDFKAERHFRECIFLKNWLKPYQELKIQSLAAQGLETP